MTNRNEVVEVDPDLLDQLNGPGIESIEDGRRAESTLPISEDEAPDDDSGEPTPDDSDELSARGSDDLVRIYLTQMGALPLLTREQEISLARAVEVTRRRFRRSVLECHFALANAVGLLKKVHAQE
jgi:RNA polymerase primary sigma factor